MIKSVNQTAEMCEEVMDSDVLGWASSPEPAEPSPFKPEPKPSPDKGFKWARAWLEISEARARGSSLGFYIWRFGTSVLDWKGL